MKMLRPTPPARGAATLVVVMVLFFIVALVAAYTSRNLIFEQRTSANQYRATQAFEAAEAGLEWALTMLNSGRIDTACTPHADPATVDESFRLRYLDIAPDRITARLRTGGGLPRQAACVFDGAGWQCSCPTDVAPSLAAPVGDGPFPAFVLRFHDMTPEAVPAPYPAGVVRIESTGCTRLDADAICSPTTSSGDGRATVTIVAALKSALATPPRAAVTVRGNLTGEERLHATNTDEASGGITLRVGGDQIAGTPDASVHWPDASLAALALPDPAKAAGRMFASVFAAARDTYRLQPAAVHVDCNVDCSAATVRDLARLNPGRVLWVEGNLDINIADPIGSADFPLMVAVTGDLTISDAAARLNGLVYVVGQTLTTSGGLLNGGLIAENDLSLAGGGTSSIVYDADVLNLLHGSSGSFVRIPGSWRDF